MIVLVCLESPTPSLASRAALRLACSLGEETEVVVLTVGSETKGASIELARPSAAVRRIIRLQDTAFSKADFLTLGMILAEAARYLEARVVFAGEHSDSEGQGIVPAALAHHLRAPLFARVHSVHLPAAQNGKFENLEILQMTVRSGGRLCKVTSPLPVVLTTSPSHTSDPQPLEVRNPAPALEVLSLAQLGVDASRLVPRPDLLGTFAPAPAEIVQHKSFDEAARILLRRQ